MIENFQLLRPLWLLATIPALILTLSLWRARSSGANWQRAIAPDLLEYLLDQRQEQRARWPWWLVFAGWVLGCAALAGPTWEKLPQPVLQKRDAVVVVLDLSLSMLAADVQPSRLQRARFKILDLLARRKEGLTGLVVYSGDAHVVTPLTDDTATIANLVPALAPDMMPLYGSDVTGGIEQALQLLHSSGVTQGRILLLTDDIENADIGAITNALGKTRHTLSIIGVGTTQGAPIPVNAGPGEGGFLKQSDGSIAVPQLHRDRLQQLAASNEGNYRDLSANDDDLNALLPNTTAPDETLRTTERKFDQWRERGPWLALLILPLAALAFRRGWLVLLLATVLIAPHETNAAENPVPETRSTATHPWLQRGTQLWRDLWTTPDQQAAKMLAQGDARAAAEKFSDPAWRASAHYRAGDYEKSAQNFHTLQGADGKTSADADYNRGNALARAGQLQQAIAAYDEALKKNPALSDAKDNRTLVEEILKQQQQTEPDAKSSESKDPQKNASQQQAENSLDASQNPNQDPSQANNSDSKDTSPDNQNTQPNGEQDAARHDAKDMASSNAEDKEKAQTQQQPKTSPAAGKKDVQASEQQAASTDKTQPTPEEQRQQQLMEQWLRQIPDEPAGLLRRKFDYEHRQRAQQRKPAGDRPLY
ncbi:MAG: VWA domain-containing protein [Spongiibacteraceae bacterium]